MQQHHYLSLNAAAPSHDGVTCWAFLFGRAMLPNLCVPLSASLNSKSWLTAVFLLVHSAACFGRAVTVAANTRGLYVDYYNSGFASTPITAVPNYTSLTPANSSFDYSTTGNFGDPQLQSNDTYCGGVYHGYLYTAAATTFLVGVQSKDGFSLTVNGYTISSSSEFLT